jgi:tetratricopeptide (TPR) repeat protein
VHAENGAKKLQAVADAMNLKSKGRVSILLRGHHGALPVDEAQLRALVRALGGGDEEIARSNILYQRAKRAHARAASDRTPARKGHGRMARSTSAASSRQNLRHVDGNRWIGPTISMVGRRIELEQINRWVKDLMSGRGRTILIEGEPGIGKSSIMQAAAQTAYSAGCQVVWAHCDELSEAFPLLPILDALADMDHTVDCSRITELLRSTYALDSRVDPVSTATELLLGMIKDLCTIGPLMLVVDDLQWADAATVAALGRLARVAPVHPLLLTGITRPVPRRQDLAVLRRLIEPNARLSLPPLSPEEVVEFLRGRVDGAPSRRLSALASGAAGNPFYLTELLDALVRSDLLTYGDECVDISRGSVPQSLSAAIADRLEFLSKDAREVIRIASLLGIEFSASELATVSDRSVGALLPALNESLAAGVLHGQGSRLAFRHPLIRAALYAEMPSTVRAAWHGEAAKALATAGGTAEQVGRQLMPAIQGERTASADVWAIQWLVNAGHQLTGQAPHVAIPLLRWALASMSKADVAYDQLTCRLADALFRVGDYREAAAVASAALVSAQDADIIVDLHWTLAQCRGIEGRSDESIATLEQALHLQILGPRHRARLLALTARMYRSSGNLDAARRVAHEALGVAADAKDRWATGWALGVLAIVHAMLGTEAQALKLLDEALSATKGNLSLNDLRLMLLINRACLLSDTDQHDEAIDTARVACRLAKRSGNLVRLVQAQSVLGEAFLHVGRWDEALAAVKLGSAGTDDPTVECADRGVAALIRLHRGDVTECGELADAEAFAARIGERVVGTFLLARSLEREWAGEPTDALEVLLDGLFKAGQQAEPLSVLIADAARLAVYVGDYDRSVAIVRQADALALASSVPHRRAIALHCRGLVGQDSALLLEAANLYDVACRPLPRAQALEAALSVLTDEGDFAGAQGCLDGARAIYYKLRASWDLTRLNRAYVRNKMTQI